VEVLADAFAGDRLADRKSVLFLDEGNIVVDAIARLRSRSCTIDGEAVACGPDGVHSMTRRRGRCGSN
jgi:hypothetical protein